MDKHTAASYFWKHVVQLLHVCDSAKHQTHPVPASGTPPHTAANGGSASEAPPPSRIRIQWMRHLQLQLGQLGLTRSDVSRLAVLRQSCAARVVQRTVRR